MKLTRISSFAIIALALAAPMACAGKGNAAAAGKGDPAKKTKRLAHKAAKPFDKNSDGAITGDESAELRKAFDADKTEPLKAFDKNTDGMLDDNEIAAIHFRKPGEGGKGGKKKKDV